MWRRMCVSKCFQRNMNRSNCCGTLSSLMFNMPRFILCVSVRGALGAPLAQPGAALVLSGGGGSPSPIFCSCDDATCSLSPTGLSLSKDICDTLLYHLHARPYLKFLRILKIVKLKIKHTPVEKHWRLFTLQSPEAMNSISPAPSAFHLSVHLPDAQTSCSCVAHRVPPLSWFAPIK